MPEEFCKWCQHSLLNNRHGFDQNDFYYDPDVDNYYYGGTCTYCNICCPRQELKNGTTNQ